MDGDGELEAVLRPSLLVGVVSKGSRAGVAGGVTGVLLAPVAWAAGLPATSLSLGLVGAGVVAASLWAVVRHYTVEYRIYEERIEVVDGVFGRESRIAPRADIRYASLSAGTLADQVGGGDVVVTVHRDNTRFRLRLSDIGDAEAWYERLRPVESGEPMVAFSRRIGPSVLTTTAWLAGAVGCVATVLASVALLAVPSLSLSLLGLWTLSVWAIGTVWYFIYVAGIEYRIHGDHIERCRIFFGTERTYAVVDHIDTVEHIRHVAEQLFDVGTVSVQMQWREAPFHLRSVDGSNEVYRELRQSA